ncbi:Uridine-cytidine kinase-like 1 [Leucoagaricus sp. SymC.cos]|nr:Uridine-cytidine kinase-like 1 [Leucoagaricus sp. SymC.cos]
MSTSPIPPGKDLKLFQPKKNTVLVSHGRPPWYGEDGSKTGDAFVISVAARFRSHSTNASLQTQTHVAREIVRALGSIPTVIILSQATAHPCSQDSFYKHHTPEELVLAHANMLDFDHPDAIDMPLFASCLADLKAYRQSNIPVYSFAEHQRLEETKYLYGATVIIAEGIMALQDPALRALYDLKIFVQCDSDLMLARRIKRDVKERGRSVEGVLDQYLRFVKPSYDNFVRPTATYADIIVPGSNNAVAIELICTHVRRQLQERSNQFREKMAIPHLYIKSKSGTTTPPPELEELDLTVLPNTPQLKGILTILRDKSCSRQDFIFFVDRLSTLLVEHALAHLPYLPRSHICGVCIQRSGGALERGFRRVIRDVPIGSLLIQSDAATGEPMCLQVMLPIYIRYRHMAENTWVFLLDAQIGTGAAAFMSIRILLDHGVKEDRIVFVAFLVARGGGISILRRAFPAVKIVCAAVDDEMEEGWLEGVQDDLTNPEGVGRKVWVMQPGMGQIGALLHFEVIGNFDADEDLIGDRYYL